MNSQPPPPRSLLRHAGLVRALARSLTQDASCADDLVQDTWLSALRRPPRHEVNLRGWLGTVLRRTARRDARVSSRRGEHERVAARAEALPSVVDAVSHAEILQIVSEAVLSLEEPYRQTLLERFYMGHSAAEIARRHGIPAATVRSRVKRALDELRERLDRRVGGRDVWSAALLALGNGGLVMSTSTKIVAATVLVAGLVLIPILRQALPRAERPGEVAGGATAELEPAELVPPERNAEPEAPEVVLAATPARREVAPIPEEEPAPPTGALVMRVVYAADGSPAAGIGLELVPWNVRTSVRDRDAIDGGPRTTTDADGLARVDSLPPGHFWVSTVHGGQPHAPEVVADEETELLIELEGLNLEGVVVDVYGDPVAGASVELAQWARSPITVPKRVATTDAFGRFDVRAVPSLCSVGARAPGHAPSMWYQVLGGSGNRIELSIALQGDGARVRGVVVDPEGEPLANAAVLIGRLEMDLRTTTLADGSKVIAPRGQRVQTDASGTFELDGCPVGEVSVAVRARESELAPWSSTVELDPGGPNELEIRLEYGVIVTGVVFEASGEPARRVEIQVKGAQPFADRNLVTAEDGSYRLGAVRAREFEITAWTDERGEAAASLSGVPGESLVWNPRLGHGIELRGVVLDETGAPVAGAFVYAYVAGSSEGNTWGHADDQGRFILSNCPEGGELLVLVETERHGDTRVEGVDPLALAGEGLVIRMPLAQEPVSIVGDVILPDGSSASATIRGTGQFHWTTGETGRIAIEGVLPGTHSLVIEAAGYSRTRLGPKRLGPGEIWDVGTIHIQHGGSLLLRAREFDRVAYFQIFDADGRWYSNLHTDEGTRESRLGLMEPGSYSLAVSGDGVAVQWILFEVSAKQEIVLDVELSTGVSAEVVCTESVSVLLHLEHDGVVVAHHWIRPRGDKPTRWTSAGFAPGAYVAEIEAADGRKGRREFSVSPQEPGPLEILVEFH